MAKKKAADKQELWEERIGRAKKVRTAWKERFQVDKIRDYIEGQQNEDGKPPSEHLTINKTYTALKALLPSLYSHDPYFYLRLRRAYNPNPMDIALWEKRCDIRAANLNYYKEELELKTKARRCIRDAMSAYGILKVHYYTDAKQNPDAGRPALGTDGEPLTQNGEFILEPDTIPVNERYCLTHVLPDDFLWDEDASTDPDTWSWVAQRIRLTLEQAREDSRINQSALKGMEGKAGPKDEEYRKREERKKGTDVAGRTGGDTREDKKKLTDPLVTWEIYNIKKKTWLWIAEGAEQPLVEEENFPAEIKKHPYALLRFFERDDSPYTIPPFSQGLDPQREYNEVRSKLMVHRKRFNRKYWMQGSAFSDPETAASKLESGEDGTVLIADQPVAYDPVKAIQDAPLDQMNYQESMLLNADMAELFEGTHNEARGIARADSATQAGILEKRMEIREGDMLSLVVDFVKDVARKLDRLIQAHIDRDQAVKISGPEGEFWQLVRTSDYDEINGEYAVEVNVGATVPQLPQMERASFMAVLGVFASAPQLLLSKRLVKEITRMHHMEDETLVDELVEIGQKMMQAQAQGQNTKPGSQPNVTERNPIAIAGGQAGGPQSLMLPGAGNLGG